MANKETISKVSMIKPGATSLNMYDVASNLETVHGHICKVPAIGYDVNGKVVNYRKDGMLGNPVLPEFQKEIINADDTDLVAGVTADTIAKAIDKDHRDTVQNAIMFDGHPVEHFMTVNRGASLNVKTKDIAKRYSSDIASLRDEMYQLKHELMKKGIIDMTQNQFGYSDIFRNGEYPYENEMLGVPTANCPDKVTILLDESVVSNLDVGDFIAVYYKEEMRVDVRQIKAISKDAESITVDEDLTGFSLKPDNMEIYKSFGISRNGNFYFAKEIESKMSDKVMWTGLDDDTSPVLYRPVNEHESSYAYSFRIPESKAGYLTEFQISARAHGTPTLTCYIIDEQDIGNFQNPEQARRLYENGDVTIDGEPKMHFFAKSKPVQLDPMAGEVIIPFNFYNEATGSYPLINRKDTEAYRVRYVAVICGTFVDESNYATIRFLQNSKSGKDLETNNTVYMYERQEDTASVSALTTKPEFNNKDLYYQVVLHGVAENEMKILNRGLYTAKMERPEGQLVSRARLTMRFRREGGLWDAVVSKPDVYTVDKVNMNGFNVEVYRNNPLKKDTIQKADSLGLSELLHKPLELRDADHISDTKVRPTVIIGTNIVNADTVAGNQVNPEQAALVRPHDMVYRNGYIVRVKGKKIEYDPQMKKRVVTDQSVAYLKPIAVIPDGHKKKDDEFGDRVVFEGDFLDAEGAPQFFNELELQVYWEKPTFSEDQKVAETQMGVIHDLVFSTDQMTC